MSKLVSRIGLVSAFTMVSRVLGLLRDMLTSALLGTSVWNSAFITAFTLPNLFRRLLGEGALTAALMPNLSEELERNGRNAVHELVNKVLSWLALACVLLTIFAWIALHFIKNMDVSEKWGIVANLGQLLFPYVLFICIAAILAAALNLFGRFGVPSLTAVWLNTIILIALGYAGWSLGADLETKTYWLSGGALFGGMLQMIVPAIALTKEGWKPKIDFKISPRVKEVALLTVPGVFGAAVFQINILVSRNMAYYVNDAAASLLYYANRLVELPVGVFAIAISTVIFPSLSKAIACERWDEFAEIYKRGTILCMLFAIPSTVGLTILAPEIIELLFQRGLFTEEDTSATIPLVVIFALGMPFYSFVSVEMRAFFAMKDTRTPVRVAILAFVVNVVFSLSLMSRFEATGLAIASNLSVVVQAVFLHLALRRKNLDTKLRSMSANAVRILLASLAMGIVIWYGSLKMEFLDAWMVVASLILLGALVYFLSLRILGLDWKKLLEK